SVPVGAAAADFAVPAVAPPGAGSGPPPPCAVPVLPLCAVAWLGAPLPLETGALAAAVVSVVAPGCWPSTVDPAGPVASAVDAAFFGGLDGTRTTSRSWTTASTTSAEYRRPTADGVAGIHSPPAGAHLRAPAHMTI